MKRLSFLIFLLSALVVSCQNSAGQSAVAPEGVAATLHVVNDVLSPDDYRARLAGDPDVQLLDVRTPREYQEGHIEGALNIDFLNKGAFEAGIKQLDPERPVMLYCRSGRRSAKAAEQLEALGFREVHDLRGGYQAWPHK